MKLEIPDKVEASRFSFGKVKLEIINKVKASRLSFGFRIEGMWHLVLQLTIYNSTTARKIFKME